MARLVLAEKGIHYSKRPIDILVKAEQFEGWYIKLNPRAVVPTLALGNEIVTDTILIVQRLDKEFGGPSLTPADAALAELMRDWLSRIMAVHYGVLLYSRTLDSERRSPMMVSRLEHLLNVRQRNPDAAEVLDKRIEGNRRLQAIFRDPEKVQGIIDGVQALVRDFESPLQEHAFLVGDDYSLADAFCTAALARLELHGYSGWWAQGELPAVNAYYERMQARPSFQAAGVVNRGNLLG